MKPVGLLPLCLAVIALLGCGCRTAAPGYRKLSESEATLHAPTGLAFPSQVGQFQRTFAQQKLYDPARLRVCYGHLRRSAPAHLIIVTVEPSSVSPSETLASRKRSFVDAHANAVVAQPLSRDRAAVFQDWQTVIFDYSGFVADFPPPMRHQPRRMLYAARTYAGHTLFLESNSFDPSFGPVFVEAADKLVRDLFPAKP